MSVPLVAYTLLGGNIELVHSHVCMAEASARVARVQLLVRNDLV